jgi:DNA-binding MarR family transcriptional regulator
VRAHLANVYGILVRTKTGAGRRFTMTEPDNPEEDALRTASKVRRAITRMGRRLRALRSSHAVNTSQLSMLGHLYRANQSMTATDLARLERLQPQSLSRTIAELDEQGLIRRCQDDADRRQLLIEITSAGKDLLLRDAERQSQWLASLMTRQLSKAEREIVSVAADLLDELAEQDDISVLKPGGSSLEQDDE